MSSTAVGPGLVRLDTSEGRWVLTATVLGSSLAMLTGTVVNVALPSLGGSLGATTAQLQWVLNGYLLSLASLILVGGSLGDRYGHRPVFVVGVTLFGGASLLCALAPGVVWLIAFRLLQGVGAALFVPESLAILQTALHPDDRGRAVGLWSALGGIAAAVGPVVGGWLVDVSGWRAVFVLVVPLAVAVAAVGLTRIPRGRGSGDVPPDLLGGLGILVAMGLSTFALIRGAAMGFGEEGVRWGLAGGVVAFGAFLAVERRSDHPMLPLSMFRRRAFAVGNAVTLVVYSAIGGSFFLLVLHLQVGMGYTALEAGASLLPVTAIMLVLSAPAGDFAQRRGSRLPLTVGPIVVGLGLGLMAAIRPPGSYWTSVFPAVAIFGLGLATTVAPVTSTVLAAAPEDRKGAASGINNAVSRFAQLLAVATFPAIAGLTGEGEPSREVLLDGFPRAAIAMAAVAAAGGVLSWLLLEPGPPATGEADGPPVEPGRPVSHCAVDGAPLTCTRAPDGAGEAQPGQVRGP